MSQDSHPSSGHLEFYLYLQSTSLLVHWIHCPNPKAEACSINCKHLLSPRWKPCDYSLIICSFYLNLLGRSAWIPDLPDVGTGHPMPLQIFKYLQFLTSACSDQTTVTLRLISTLLCYLPTPRTGNPCASKFSLNPISVKGEDGEGMPVHFAFTP